MLWIFTILSVFLTAAKCLDEGCTSISGTCQKNFLHCSGNYVSGLCSDQAGMQCCIQGLDESCTSISGTCQGNYLNCSGNYVPGLCSGHASRQCCVQECSKVNIVSRSQWGARSRQPNDVSNFDTPVHEFFIHQTESSSCQTQSECSSIVRGIQNYHMDSRGWTDIGYSFLVGEDGNVYEGRGWSCVETYTSANNNQSFAASMIGNFTNQLPNSQALTAVKNLIACGVEQGKIAGDYRLYGHRDSGQTNCPGDALYNEIQTWPHYSYTNL